jgi:hypothetical protein
MKKLILAGLLIVLTLPLILTACGSSQISATLGTEFTLPAGKTAVISGESLKIKFVEVTGDSRCATGVECVRAGDAQCLMLIYKGDSQTSLTFVQDGSNEVNSMDFNVYNAQFRLEPYPVKDSTIKPEDYKLIMTVTKFVEKP